MWEQRNKLAHLWPFKVPVVSLNWNRWRRGHAGAPQARQNDYKEFFRYTSGRWLYDEQDQLTKRYVEFNVQGLRHVASQTFCSPCVAVSKLPEGLYNKVFLLRMENQKEVLARIPNPNAGHAHRAVASEVATLDFLRTVLDIPVPTVIRWSSLNSDSPNPVGTDFIMMERVKGRQLCNVWPTMSEAERFGLVRSVVEIERRLTSTKLSNYGSLFYRHDHPNGVNYSHSAVLDTAGARDTSKYVIGSVTDKSFWTDERSKIKIDRGPWDTSLDYLVAIARREIAWIKQHGSGECFKASKTSLLSDVGLVQPEAHIKLLEQFLSVLPYIIPSGKGVDAPVLWHNDLHDENIFVDDQDPTKITGIIDWQGIWAAPLFMQARVPSIFESDAPYRWGANQPKLPTNFESLSQAEKESASMTLKEQRLKKFYEMASRKFNSPVFDAMDIMNDEEDPTTFILSIIENTSAYGTIALRELLIEITEKWEWLTRRRGIEVSCPISFTEDEIREARAHSEEWAEAFNEYDHLRGQIVGKDGWVSHEEYDEALAQFNAYKPSLERLRAKLDQVIIR